MRAHVTHLWLIVLAGLFAIAVLSGLVSLGPGTLALIAVCFACETIDSSLGMGFGTTLTPVLLIAGFEPHQLVPTILVSEFLSGFASFFFHAEAGNVKLGRKSRHLHAGFLLSAASVLGVAAGVLLALSVSARILTRLIGVVILASGIVLLIYGRRTFAFRRWKIALLGLVASFNKALSGGGYGPLMTSGQVLSGIEGKAAVGITSLAEGFTCLGGSLLFLTLGKPLDPGLLIVVITGALASVPLSARVVRRLSEAAMKRVIALLTLALGAFTLMRSLG